MFNQDVIRPRLIIFDLDGTIADSEPIIAKTSLDTCLSFGADQLTNFDAKSMQTVLRGKNFNFQKQWVQDTFGIEPEAYLERYGELYVTNLTRDLKPVDGAIELLEILSAINGLQLCVATNGFRKWTGFKLDSAGLTKFFGDRVFTSDDVKNPKPAPDIFLHACASLNFELSEAFIVEDSVTGVTAAIASTIPFVGFTGTSDAENAAELRSLGRTVDSLNQLPELLGFV